MPSPFRFRLDGGVNFSDAIAELLPGELAIARNCHYLPESSTLYKVRGNASFGFPGALAAGLVFQRFRSAGSFLVAKAGNNYTSAIVGGSGAWTPRATGLLPAARMNASYHPGTDRAYFSDGVNPIHVWGGTGNMRSGGLLRPNQATLTFLNNTQTSYRSITTYYYTHTEYDSVNDVESAPAEPVQTSASVEDGTFKYQVPTKRNSSADRLRVYRTQHGGDIFFLIAEFPATNIRYYDGADTEALGLSYDNDDEWGFNTVDDDFLSTRRILPMIGRPILGNYVTANGDIPVGSITGLFQNSLFIAGVSSFPQDLYYSMADFPEMFSPSNFIREDNPRGEPITGAGVANDRLIVFTTNSIYRHNAFPLPDQFGYGTGFADRQQVTSDHGCVAEATVTNFGVGQPNNRLFYVSTRGPMMTDSYETWPLNEDLDWDVSRLNLGAMSGAVAVNYPKYAQIWLFVPSANSLVNDIAFVYHYHPNHLKRAPVGKWTGPIHVRGAAAAVTYDVDSETRMYVADTDFPYGVYQADTGLHDAMDYARDGDGKILWEWETGDQNVGAESVNKRTNRVFLSTVGTDSFSGQLTYAVNKSDKEHLVKLKNISDNKRTTQAFGASQLEKKKTRTYRGGVWKTGSHLRWRMVEEAKGERGVAALEAEVEPFGRQK